MKDSKLHSALNRELKIKSNAGTIFERNELQKVFHQRRIKSSQKEVIEEKTPIQAELEGRLKGELRLRVRSPVAKFLEIVCYKRSE